MMNTRSPTRWEGIAPGPGGGAGAGASDGAGRRRERCGFTGLGRGSVGVLVYWLFVQHKARPCAAGEQVSGESRPGVVAEGMPADDREARKGSVWTGERYVVFRTLFCMFSCWV